MMEGYSVTEAASVLGVPTERVWELLARGVLSGKPEGEAGMRVYLQPRPAPSAPEAPRANGNGGTEPQRELSPFRELLTEFRSLTERYGQALLALGEARGEVASLRSRVDLLEARMDLRLPSTAAPSPVGWATTPMPFQTERTVMPAAPAASDERPSAAEPQHEPEVEDAAHDGEEEERRARRRGPRRATESFAEALARAEDPSVPELPGAAQAAAALAALREEAEATTDFVDATLPRELPAADTVPVADETGTAEVDVTPGPERVEEEPEFLAGEPEAVAEEPESVAEEPEAAVGAEAEPEFVVDAPAWDLSLEPVVEELEAMAKPEPAADEPEPAESLAAEPSPAGSELPATREAEPLEAEQPDAAPPLGWDAERYTTAIEEPDWFEAEVFAAEQPAAEQPAAEQPAAELPPGESSTFGEDERAGEPQVPAAMSSAGAETPELEMTEVEVEGPAEADPASASASNEADAPESIGEASEEDSGAAEMEVATTGRRPAAEATDAPTAGMPGGFELDRALAALDALAGRTRPEPAEPTPGTGSAGVEAAEPEEWPPPLRSLVEPRAPQSPQSFRPSPPTTGPASRAYRRLRRIFPG